MTPHMIMHVLDDRAWCHDCDTPIGGDNEAHLVHETDCTMPSLGYCTCPREVCADCCPTCHPHPQEATG